ncbi:MAG TPA: hypothetical protein VMA74_08580 [Dyella sp.]|uniref:hypothetical protein n=1 Tax=Dyella sp. TaxID=1869338 RepID=UPI002C3DB9C0|nr:hypothetical protein [Dyella sp.]HUB89772.1 hypothetical protein [Dyella sp.]
MHKVTRAALGIFMGLSLSGLAIAAEAPATGLGQAWPNAVDVSLSPHWHVYVFVLDGVKYIQVNDINGNVVGAVGTAGGQFITLPIGEDAQYVSTPQQRAAHLSSMKAATPTTVYRDSATVVTATPLNNGTTALDAAATTSCPDPEQCGNLL